MNDNTQIYFPGQNISSTYISHLLEMLEGKDISINVISKSGTTTEPAIAFRIFRDYLEKKYGKEEAKTWNFCYNGQRKRGIKQLATEEGFETFVIPDDVGGSLSVPNGSRLITDCSSSYDVDKMMEGAGAAAGQIQ